MTNYGPTLGNILWIMNMVLGIAYLLVKTSNTITVKAQLEKRTITLWARVTTC
jgi:hypothetical protein